LRTMVKVDVDLDALTKENEADYATRRIVNREVDTLAAQAAAVIYSPGLPKETLDESEISQRIEKANRANKELATTMELRGTLAENVKLAERNVSTSETNINGLTARVEKLEEELAKLKALLKEAHLIHPQVLADLATAQQKLKEAPSAELIDVQPLNDELADARLANREIAKRERREELERQLAAKRAEAAALGRAMENRDEHRRMAIANAQMPVGGLSFNEDGVLFKGLPLQNLGEAEQIRVSLALAMASNPKLRAVPIGRGESLDDESLALIDQMAEEQDFQIFMAKVDTSGAVGIVLNDGLVERVNE
jgi:hypothetical protein